jgi:hypothetical protein
LKNLGESAEGAPLGVVGAEPRAFVVVGNPENRRVALFEEALARRGFPPPRIVRWIDLARGEPVTLPDDPAFVRIDSFGEDFEVERAFLMRGHRHASRPHERLTPDAIAALAPDRGRILAPRQHHLGFLEVLGELEALLAARPWLVVLNHPRAIRDLFDKRACAGIFTAARIPIPRPLPPVATPGELRMRMAEADTSRVFVKLTCGSSASCLALLHDDPDSPDDRWLFTSVEIDGERLYNSLHPRRYHDRASIDRILRFLLGEGSQIEEAVPKARIGGRFFDTRVLVVGGEVAFTVVRKSLHPVTNLHLGGVRGTEDELAAAVPAAVRESARASCRKVAAAFDSLQIGIDVMYTPHGEDHRVLEANAFGDLLPNLVRDGLSVYEWQIADAERRRR